MTHQQVWLIIGFGMSERTFMVEVRGVFAHIADAHNHLTHLRSTEPGSQFRIQTHALMDVHCNPVPARYHKAQA